MRALLLIALLATLDVAALRGQVSYSDTIEMSGELSEAVIETKIDPEDAAFSFYQSNKLANTDEVLARIQGVNMIKRGAYGLEPILRNYGSGQTNLTIDGMRIYGACTDRMDPISIYIEPINLQSIDVTHGASGSFNGSTIGGQIDMRFREPGFSAKKKVLAKISQSFSSVNLAKNTSVSLMRNTPKLATNLSGIYRKADDYTAGGGVVIPYSGYEKFNMSLVAKLKIDSSQQLKFNYLGDWARNIGYPALPMDVGQASAQILALSHGFEFAKNKLMHHNELKVYFNSIYHEMDDSHRSDIRMHMDMPGSSKTFGFYDELMLSNMWKFRLDYHRSASFANMTMYPESEPIMFLETLPSNKIDDLGLSFKKAVKLKRKQEIRFQGRFDYIRQFAEEGIGADQWEIFDQTITRAKSDFLKNFSFSYDKSFGDKTLVTLTSSYGERIPTSNERYGYFLFNRQDRYDYLGKLGLKPEKSVQTEFYIKQDYRIFHISCNLFYHHTKDFVYAFRVDDVSPVTYSALGVKQYKNITYATSKGFEFNTSAEVSDLLTYILAVKYVYAQTNDQVPLALVPPLKVQHAAKFSLKNYRFQIEHDYALAQNRINPDFGDVTTPSFHLINLRASKNFQIGDSYLQVGVACENLLDASYWEHLDVGQIPRPGRNFLINVNLIL